MNLITEYASRASVAINLFKSPSSLIAVTEGKDKIPLKPRILTFSPILGNPQETMLRLYGIGSGDLPELLKEQNLFTKYLFDPEALKPIFENCRMIPYSFGSYPAADIVYNDPPQSQIQENNVIKYFQTFQNSSVHQEYRRMVVWCSFVTENAGEEFLAAYGQKINSGNSYVHQDNVKKYDKKLWKKWEVWCEKLYLRSSSDWANEMLFARCLPRMRKKDMATMSIPICEDVETVA